MAETVELYDEFDFINMDVARCPQCKKQLLSVDKEDEIVFCVDNPEDAPKDRGCGWSGKECEMDYV